MEENIERLLEKLAAHKKKLDGLRPFSKGIMAKLKEYYDVEGTYNSNAIEGNTLSLGETKLVILDGVTIGGKSVREHLEAINHKKAIDYLESVVSQTSPISEDLILAIHKLILREIDDENAGVYRSTKVHISGSRYAPPDPIAVPHQMKEFIAQINQAGKHPVIAAADAHYGLVTIHPFIDGNGRCARLLMNLLFMQEGYPPVIVPVSRREEYIKSLDKAQTTGEMAAYYILICECTEYSLAQYMRAVE